MPVDYKTSLRCIHSTCCKTYNAHNNICLCTVSGQATFWKQLDKKMGIRDNSLDNLWAAMCKKLPKRSGVDDTKAVPPLVGRPANNGKGRFPKRSEVKDDLKRNSVVPSVSRSKGLSSSKMAGSSEGQGFEDSAPLTGTATNKKKQKKSHNLLACFRCKQEFSSGRQLLHHVKTHDDPRLLCGYCSDLAFETFTSLVSHVEETHFVCHVADCYIYVSTANGLKYHSTHVHESLTDFKCSKCDCTFKTLQPKNKHEKACDAQITNPNSSASNQEMDTSEVSTAEVVLCKFCGETCKDELAQCSHEMWCNKNENRVMVCKICDKLFKGKEKLKHHLTKGHNQGNFLCNFCHHGFATLADLKSHYPNCEENEENLLSKSDKDKTVYSTRSRSGKK